MRFSLTIAVLYTLLSFSLSAQKRVCGVVSHSETNEPLPFTNVMIAGSTKGTITGMSGEYCLSVLPGDILVYDLVGFEKKEILYNGSKGNIHVKLVPGVISLKDVVIKPGKNPAHEIIKMVSKNRNKNDPTRFNAALYKEYIKIGFSLKNLDSSFLDRSIFKNNPGIIVYDKDRDSMAVLPLYFRETIDRKYYQRSPSIYGELNIADREDGLNVLSGDFIDNYSENLNSEASFYDNHLLIIGKGFPSPIGKNPFIQYRYKITDTIKSNDDLFLRIDFSPKTERDLAFTGYLIVHKNTYAITEINASLLNTANLNYIQSLRINENFQRINDSTWYYKQKNISIELAAIPKDDSLKIKEITTISGFKRAIYDSVKVGESLKKIGFDPSKKIVEKEVDSDMGYDSSYWSEARFEGLQEDEISHELAIETTKSIKMVEITDKLLQMTLFGYYPMRYLEFGPYLNTLKRNAVEGYKLTIGLRTSEKIMTKGVVSGFTGYGFKDERFKFGFGYEHLITGTPCRTIGFRYYEDYYKIGELREQIKYVRENVLVQTEDNLISVLLQRQINKEVYFLRNFEFKYSNDWSKNFINTLYFNVNRNYSPELYPFKKGMKDYYHFDNYEINLHTRISFNQEISNRHFRRIYFNTKTPVINVVFGYGHFDIKDGEKKDYQNLRLVLNHKYNTNIGYVKYSIESGMTIGSVPYPLLEVHRSNQGYGDAFYYFNRMNNMEYGSDMFASLMAEYSLKGLFFNRVPLIKRLKLREIISYKGAFGVLDQGHEGIIDYPFVISELPDEGYHEIGVGFSNLFNLFRFQYIWRLSERNKKDVSPQGVHFRIKIAF